MTTTSPVALVVGLGNPGDRYSRTRHNAGLQFLQAVAAGLGTVFSYETRFEGAVATGRIGQQEFRMFAPATFMNESGRAVAKIVRYYKIPVERVLVAHDELDLPPGVARLKCGGGHGGHNGLRDILQCLGSREFKRLRIGIGHPGSARQVVDYVLQQPSKADAELIESAIDAARRELPAIIEGKTELAMNALHGSGRTAGSP